MVKYLIIGSIWFCSYASFAQSPLKTYEVVEGEQFFTTEFETILNNTNWDKYRMQTERRILQFENGFSIELYSASEMDQLNIPYNHEVILNNDQVGSYQPKYRINDTGHILELHTYKLK